MAALAGVGSLFAAPARPEGAAATGWVEPGRTHRLPLLVETGLQDRRSLPVTIEIPTADLGWPEGARGLSGARLVEIDPRGRVREADPEWQLDGPTPERPEHAILTVTLGGVTPSRRSRRFQLYFTQGKPGEPHTPQHPQVHAGINEEYRGQPAIEVTATGSMLAYFHTEGGGFASIIDPQGNDWISYSEKPGAEGKFRGIPNLVHPEGLFHPGGQGCRTALRSAGGIRSEWITSSRDGKWVCRWEMFPAFARCTILKAAGPYWFLYEGTPGGSLDLREDYLLLPNGKKVPASQQWAEPLKGEQWVFFADGKADRGLWLAQAGSDEAVDSYRPMNGLMTVFGFGRLNLEKQLSAAPQTFYFGLVESRRPVDVRASAAQQILPVQVHMGEVERKAE